MITKLGQRVIECKHLSGMHRGQLEIIPRIKLFSDSAEFPFTFARVQFPIRPAFAMTVNKSQVLARCYWRLLHFSVFRAKRSRKWALIFAIRYSRMGSYTLLSLACAPDKVSRFSPKLEL